MATFKRFEEIQAWQKARKATKLIYEKTGKNEFHQRFWIARSNQALGSLNYGKHRGRKRQIF